MTRREGHALYIVKENNTRVGIACPAWIRRQVLQDELETRPARAQQQAARQQRETDAAGLALGALFPAMPAGDARGLLRTAWKVGSGRVGRAGALDMGDKVRLAAQAFARHRFTDYDDRLARGQARGAVREATRPAVLGRLRVWKGLPETNAAPGEEKQVGHAGKKNKRASNVVAAGKRRPVRNAKRPKKKPS